MDDKLKTTTLHDAMQQRCTAAGVNQPAAAGASSSNSSSSSSSSSSTSSSSPAVMPSPSLAPLHEHAIQASNIKYLREPLQTLKSYVETALKDATAAQAQAAVSHQSMHSFSPVGASGLNQLHHANRLLQPFTSAIEHNENRVMVVGDTGAGQNSRTLPPLSSSLHEN